MPVLIVAVLSNIEADELYRALDWLHEAQPAIEKRLARQHLAGSTLVLYDLTSTWLTGRCCPLAARGHSRDGKRDDPQIVFGLICNADGCPIAVEVFEGNRADPATVSPPGKTFFRQDDLERRAATAQVEARPPLSANRHPHCWARLTDGRAFLAADGCAC